MKVKQIEYSLGRTINAGIDKYEFARVDIKLVADLDEGDNAGKAFANLKAKVWMLMQSEVEEILSQKTRTWSKDDE